MTCESIGCLLVEVCDAEDHQCSAWFHRRPTCFTAPVRNVWELQKGLKPLHPPSWTWNAFVIKLKWSWDFRRSSVCWYVEWLMNMRRDQTAGERKHIPPPHDVPRFGTWDVCEQNKCEQCILPLLGPLQHTAFLFLCVYLKMLWEFHWTWFSLSLCFHVAFYFYNPWHIEFLLFVVLITPHAVKRSLGKVKAEWIKLCVFVCVWVCV